MYLVCVVYVWLCVCGMYVLFMCVICIKCMCYVCGVGVMCVWCMCNVCVVHVYVLNMYGVYVCVCVYGVDVKYMWHGGCM